MDWNLTYAKSNGKDRYINYRLSLENSSKGVGQNVTLGGDIQVFRSVHIGETLARWDKGERQWLLVYHWDYYSIWYIISGKYAKLESLDVICDHPQHFQDWIEGVSYISHDYYLIVTWFYPYSWVHFRLVPRRPCFPRAMKTQTQFFCIFICYHSNHLRVGGGVRWEFPQLELI